MYFIILVFKLFNTNGAVATDPKNNEDYIKIFGDLRDEVKEFLIHEGIGTKDNIKVHGHEI
jgi:translation initiation factor 1 (eIF-1/SUI1)